MPILRISTHIENGALDLRINNKTVISNTGAYEINLPEQQDYVVQWYVHGKERSHFSITVSSPCSAEFQLTRSIGVSNKDFGGFHFST